VSGGHCQLLVCRGVKDFVWLGGTLDDSIGEAFDKISRVLFAKLPYDENVHPGKILEQFASKGNPLAYRITLPMSQRDTCDFSFSGLKTFMLRTSALVDLSVEQQVADLAASFQHIAFKHIENRLEKAILWTKKNLPVSTLVCV